MLSTENNLINTNSILGNNPNINLHSTDNSYGLNFNQNGYVTASQNNNVFASAISLTTPAPDLIVQNVSAPSNTTVGSSIQL
ncbi:MAG: hypothetical protein V7K98_06740, partial [Nostoc sp.]|uniref:hypothetical protein n=1 Tax=Nostoc sp. TaxID=1180 RepID=UPI002FF984BA